MEGSVAAQIAKGNRTLEQSKQCCGRSWGMWRGQAVSLDSKRSLLQIMFRDEFFVLAQALHD